MVTLLIQKAVNFKNTVIILTSNIGSEHIDKMQSSAARRRAITLYADAKTAWWKVLKISSVWILESSWWIIFWYSHPGLLRVLLGFGLTSSKASSERFLSKLLLMFEYLAEKGYDPHYGARLKRLIQNKILTPLLPLWLRRGCKWTRFCFNG